MTRAGASRAGAAAPLGVTIRRADWAQDRDALLAVRFRVFVDEQRVPAHEEVDAADERATHFLAETRDAGSDCAGDAASAPVPVGTARVVFDPTSARAKIGRMAVVRAHRGAGVGLALLRATVDEARRAGATEAALDAQVHAIPFYERLGFAAEGPVFQDAGIPHRRMRVSLVTHDAPARVSAPAAAGMPAPARAGGQPRDVSMPVTPEQAGQRLDVFLASALPSRISRSYAVRLVRDGLVHVDGRAARKGEEVTAGQTVTVRGFVAPDERAVAPNPELAVHVLHEDADVVVLDKPAGLPSHPNRYDDERSVVSFLLARYPEVRGVGDDPLRPGIAHRLDTDTSGLMVAARTLAAWEGLRAQFDARTVEKEYLALVLGVPRDGEGEVTWPLGHHPSDPRRMVAVTGPRVRTRGDPRAARTTYEVIETFGDAYALLRVSTSTGRMHQVRVHLESAGHPLAGDSLYLGPRRRKRDFSGLERHFLHAARLAFSHPIRHERIELRSALPPDLEAALAHVRSRRPPPAS